MEVILLKPVENLGEFGDKVKVTGGYARNYLIPRKLAVVVSDANAKTIEHECQRIRQKNLKILESAQQVADKLAKFTLTIKKKVGENDKLFGSVTSKEVMEGLKAKGFELERKNLTLPEEHIKELGTFMVTAKLHPEVSVEFKLKVAKE